MARRCKNDSKNKNDGKNSKNDSKRKMSTIIFVLITNCAPLVVVVDLQ